MWSEEEEDKEMSMSHVDDDDFVRWRTGRKKEKKTKMKTE